MKRYSKTIKYKYNKHQRKAFESVKKRKSKAYANRQQKFAVSTIKAIAQEVCNKQPEVKYIENLTKSPVTRYLAHPQLWLPADMGQPNLQHKPIVYKIFDQNSIPSGIGDEQRIGSQVFLKGFRMRFFLQQPQNVADGITGETWYKVTLMIVKGVKGTTPRLNQFTNEWYQSSVLRRKATKRPLLNVVWRKVVMFRPKCTAHWVSPQPVHVTGSTPTTALFLMPNKLNLASVMTPSPMTCTSSVGNRILNEYIPINKKINFPANNSAIPNPYYFIAFTHQPHLGVGSDGYYIASHNDTNVLAGNGYFNVRIGYKWTICYTDS